MPVHDLFVASVSLPAALVLRVGTEHVPDYCDFLRYGTPLFCAITACVFLHCGLYKGLWRYASLADLTAIVKGAAISVLLFVVFVFIFGRLEGLPRSVPVIQMLCLIVLLGASRFLRRALRDWQMARSSGALNNIPILLVGAQEGATLLIRSLNSSATTAPYHVVGVVDLTDEHITRSVLNVPILGTVHQLSGVLKRLTADGKRPHRIVLTTDLAGAPLIELQKEANHAHIPLARLPSLTQFRTMSLDGRIDLQPIAVEDLLRRPQVALNQDTIHGLIEGRRVLITGAGGSIGAELSRQIALRRPLELVLFESSEHNLYSIDLEIEGLCPSLQRVAILRDIRDRNQVHHVFREHRPQLIFHAAALKHVPLVENNALEGFRTNVLGTRNVAEAASACGALAFVQVSTDKAVNPTSVMGATKRLAELFCQALDLAPTDGMRRAADGARANTRFITVRFGNVAGSSGSVIPLFEKQLRQGGPLTVTHPDIKRYFMTIREAVELVLLATACDMRRDTGRGHIFVLDMGEPIRILDIAEQMIRLAGLEPYKDVEIKFVGLRPGEKLYEELFDPSEQILRGAFEGVLLARSDPVDLDVLSRALASAATACTFGNSRTVLRILTERVPGFRPREGLSRTESDVSAEVEVARGEGTRTCDATP